MIDLGTKKIETERLVLRRIESEDYNIAYTGWCNNPENVKYTIHDMHHNINETKILYDKWIAEYDNLKTYRWIIETKATQELIGTIDASSPFEKYGTISIGYICGKKHWDHGYITEAAQAV